MGDFKNDSVRKLKDILTNTIRHEEFCVDNREMCKQCFYKYFCNGICGAYDKSIGREFKDYICKTKKVDLEYEMFKTYRNQSMKDYIEKKQKYLIGLL